MSNQIKDYLITIIPAEQRWKISLFQHWDTIMGPLKDKVTIANIKEDTLLLKVIHPAWAQELFLLSNMLKQKINVYLQSNRIKNIRFVNTDTQPTKHKLNLVEYGRKTYTENLVVLSSKEAATFSHVQDEELKIVLERFFKLCKHHKTTP